MAIVAGLDWMKGKWAVCVLEESGEPLAPRFHSIEAVQLATDPDLASAALIAVDTPIGLPPGDDGCATRGCDSGAKRLLGPRGSSVFPVPVAGELEEYRRRRASGEKQKEGHFRGLLPSIDAVAAAPRSVRERMIESHPEVVFTVLAGGALPPGAGKKTLFGQLVRLGILRMSGLRLPIASLPALDPADDYLDAAAMALTARAWARGRARPAIVSSGEVALREASDPWAPFMALPGVPERAARALSEEECLVIARRWVGSSSA